VASGAIMETTSDHTYRGIITYVGSKTALERGETIP